MKKSTRKTLEIGFRWMVLGAIVWSVFAILAFTIMDKVSASGVDQVEVYNQAVHAQVPDTAFEAYK